jgi:putative hydrolase of the HAD superfamily
MKYELLLIDADDTVFDYDKAEAYAFGATCKDFEIDYEEERHLPVYRRINEAMWKALERGETDQERLATERFERTFEELGIEADAGAFGDRYLDHLEEADFLLPEAEATVASLAAKANLVLLTNGLSRVQRSRFARSPVTRHFDHIVISDEVGVKKPDPAIFELATKHYPEIAKERVLMVGDSLSSDIQGGVNSGVDTCWFNPREKPAPAKPKPTYEIRRLSQLLEL